ncbi:MAG: DUF1997 domain-containing protein [Roseofilum sp. SBFL]|uniref:DUF1997 domain-containing protein n=1 Tax=unclassified Roseofilum TaxID=2620099 RepID=UPI001B13849E|nr:MULTISPECIES: DUF1997 domain-containing protein [unclassified Roseofilum]MBP0012499.1 DUF1997 domain-containing protein [Roseofilum sp. SID3]MBP0024730.1 DUF1997 domain-containing protein [Roseofilum sp. SID2]MBP0037592.1 DUF1997 domain-containing protein [Roseofilum sp. SID1]MBP0041850.1 DUF1997 domain-containing protein [Roseofilum sp. SBFL]
MKLQSSLNLEQDHNQSDVILGAVPEYTSLETVAQEEIVKEPFQFSTLAEGKLLFNAHPQTVAEYLDDHQGWFCRCAAPMKVRPISKNGYALIIGQFGAFGYDVEPKVGLEMQPQLQGIYTINSIAVPDDVDLGYEVDFRSSMELVEAVDRVSEEGRMTYAQWTLDLKVKVYFPHFIHALPQSLIQKTGDRLLAQIVRQVSHCLNHKILKDFHQTYNRTFPRQPRN